MRPTRTNVFMSIAYVFAHRATCPRAAVGVVIARDSHIVSHGYNGAPPGMEHCTQVGCLMPEKYIYEDDSEGYHYRRVEEGCQRAVHAEANAISYAAKQGVSVWGAVMYSTHEPCLKCAQLIVGAGISEVVWHEPYREGASQFLSDAGVIVIGQYEPSA